MNVSAITRRLERLEVRAATVGPKAALILEAKREDGSWHDGSGGRWVAGDEVYYDADLRQLERRHFLILVSQHGEVTV